MSHPPIDALGLDYDALCAHLASLNGKPNKRGLGHGGALFRQIHRQGELNPSLLTEFAANPELAKKAQSTLRLQLPEIIDRSGDGVTYKYLLRLGDGLVSESVVIPMRHYKALCISSQVGCKMGCTFCETAQLGILRSLTAGEIVAQVHVARFVLKEPIVNLVFMGMGEPMDNLEEVLKAIRILSDQRGMDIAQSNITVSTVGHVTGINRLAELARKPKPEGMPHLRLAISLNAPNDAVRSQLMPVNRLWPMATLREAMAQYPLNRRGDFILCEYVLIPGVNDRDEHAVEVAEYLKGIKACVNLIPYNPRRESPYLRPDHDGVQRFFKALMAAGQYCRIRGVKGQGVMAACGQLGMRELSRRARAVKALSV